jgi:hypothetical protein
MVRKAVALLTAGIAMGVAADRLSRELRKPSSEQYVWLRARLNDRVNPWLLEHGAAGSETAEIGTLEHVGRSSGTTYFTPIHPTVRDETVLIPAPMGVGSQWALNVLKAGHARMQFHERIYELDRPELILVAESGNVPGPVARRLDRMGCRYVRFRVVASVPAGFGRHASSIPAGTPMFEGSLNGPTGIPMEPRMVTRDATTT